MLYNKLPMLKGYDIQLRDYLSANKKGGIVRLGLHIKCPKCNLSCPYCLNDEGMHFIGRDDEEVSISDVKDWIHQAYDLGVKCVVIDGKYEPLSNKKDTFELIEYIRSLNITPILITNLTLFNEDIIKKLNYFKVSVLGKLNVPMTDKTDIFYDTYAEIQQYLTGSSNRNVYDKLLEIINLLIKYEFNEVVYNDDGIPTTRLGVETVITPHNYSYIPILVRQLRELNIYVHGEQVKPQGAAGDGEFEIRKEEIKVLFENVYQEDIKNEYMRDEITPVYIDGKCIKHLATCNVNVNGDVIPCPSVELYLGNLKKEKLKDIINKNKYVNIIRNLNENIKGDCKECELFKKYKCYGGCRGYTYMYLRQKGYTIDESLVASDPSCWRVENIL